MQHNELEALLVRRGVVSPMQIRHAMALSRGKGHSWVEHLVLTGVLTDERLAEEIAIGARVPACEDLRLQRISADVLALVPADLALEHALIPVGVDSDGDVTVAMLDPTDFEAVTEVGFFIARRLLRSVARASAIGWALHTHYGVDCALYPAPRPEAYAALRATG